MIKEKKTSYTATFFYSKKQERVALSMNFLDTELKKTFIDNKQYTEVMSLQKDLPHNSNWDDAEIVCIVNNLPSDEIFKKHFNYESACIFDLDITLQPYTEEERRLARLSYITSDTL